MSSTIFSGSSRFASDFAQIIERNVSIASLPLKVLQQQKTKLDSQATALSALHSKVGTLQSSVKALENAFGDSSYKPVNSSPAAAAVDISDAPTPGSWNVGISDLGASTAFVVTGFPPVADPDEGVYTSNATQTLLVDLDPTDGLNNPEIITVSPPGQTLRSVVDKINAVAGHLVQATMVNVGSSSSPDFQLSLQSRTLGAVDITFRDGALESKNTVGQRGAKAQYTVNGAAVSSDSRAVTLAPGVTIDLLAETTSAFNISVSRSTEMLRTTLGNFVNAFNAVDAELTKHRGSGSALAGDSILNTTQAALRQLLSAVSPSGDIDALSDLGIGFDETKVLYLDSDVFDKAATADDFAQLKTFFGAVGDSGFLETADNILSAFTETGTGILSSALATVREAAKAEARHIEDQQERIDDMQKRLQAQMTAADATIAMLEQQVEYFNGMWKAVRSARGEQ